MNGFDLLKMQPPDQTEELLELLRAIDTASKVYGWQPKGVGKLDNGNYVVEFEPVPLGVHVEEVIKATDKVG